MLYHKHILAHEHLLLEQLQLCLCLIKNLLLKHIRFQWYSFIHLVNRKWSSDGSLTVPTGWMHTVEKRKMDTGIKNGTSIIQPSVSHYNA
jgi:hypothetical protein